MDRKKLLLDVLDLVLKVNGGLATRKGKGHPTAFYDYSGHTNTLYVHIHPDGWYFSKETYTTSHYDEFQFDFDHSDKELERQYERLNRYINVKLEEEEHVNVVQID